MDNFDTQQKSADAISARLRASPTAYTPNTLPTKSDMSMTNQLASINKQIEEGKSKQLRLSYYGKDNPNATEETGQKDDGFWMSGLKKLQEPLNAVAGAAQYAIGKGTEDGLFANMDKARKSGLTFGNVLGQTGMPWLASAPLGFALDVMFDPVNWMTAGTSAIIPRVGAGLVKGFAKKAGTEAAESGLEGALKGAATGLTSSLEKKAYKTMDVIPFAKNIPSYKALTEKLGEKAIAGAEKYDSLVGKNVYDRLGSGLFGTPSGVIGRTAESFIQKIPSVSILGKSTPTGEAIADFFRYSPAEAAKGILLNDKVIMLARNEGIIMAKTKAGVNFVSIDEFLRPDARVKLSDVVSGATKVIVEGADETVAIKDAMGKILPEFIGKVKVADTLENAQALLDMAGETYNLKHLTKAYQVTPVGKTGVAWYDNVIDKLKSTSFSDLRHGKLGTGEIAQTIDTDVEKTVRVWNSMNDVKGNVGDMAKGIATADYASMKPFNAMLTGLEDYVALFKGAKVPMNVGSHVVSYLGNFFMGAMMGIPTYKPEYFKAFMNARKLVRGELGAEGIKNMFFKDLNSMVELMDNNPTMFKQIYGFGPEEIIGRIKIEQKVRGMVPTDYKGVKKYMEESLELITKESENLTNKEFLADEALLKSEQLDPGMEDVLKKTLKKELGAFSTPSETMAAMVKKGDVRNAEEIGTFTTSELSANKTVDKLKNNIASGAAKNPHNVAYWLADKLVNSLPKEYEHIDQTFKVATTDFLSRVGLTEQELLSISRQSKISAEDIFIDAATGKDHIISGGEKLYRLKPAKAAEVSMEAFMNYAAMPDFVKIMRALPIVGSNFFSFQYAMAIKNAKTMINNPAAFNKIGFMLNEFSGTRTPEEKDAMNNKYNAYLNSPTVVKMMGMWNTDVKNIVPIYSMNMFNPSMKTYSDTPEGNFLKGLDATPLFQTPVGQVFKDFVIQPWVLSGTGQAPQGQFGQPLYQGYDNVTGDQIEAGAGTKAFHAARTLTEAVVPGSLSYAGLAAGALPREAVELIPSYGARNIAYAETGKSSLGAQTKENAMQKTLRAILGRTGIPAYTLDTTKSTSNK